MINLANVDFMDSSCLGAMIIGVRKIGSRGALVLCHAKEGVQKTFQLTRMDKVFPILPSVDEGIAVLSSSQP